MELRRGLRDWLLAKDSDPSVRLRVLRASLERPTDNPAVARAQKEVGRRGWAAQILNGQHPQGHWVTPGNSARELYRPKYVATNWRLLVLSDLGLTKKNARVARAVNLFVRRFSRTGDLGGPRSEVCFTGNAVRMLVRFGYLRDPHLRPAIDWLVRPQKKDGGWHCFRSGTGTLDCWEALAAFSALATSSRTPEILRAIQRGAESYLERRLFRACTRSYRPWLLAADRVHYYYDLLVGLDVLTSLRHVDDPRIRPALDLLIQMPTRDGE